MEGYVKLHRKLLENPIASNGNLLGFFCYLLLTVSHKDHSFYLGMQKVDQKKGQAIVSQKKLSKYFKVSIGTINNWLSVLIDEGIIETKGTNKYTVLTIVKRDLYQIDGKQRESNVKATGKQRETINNDKNVKEGKEVISFKEDFEVIKEKWNNINQYIQDKNNHVSKCEEGSKHLKEEFKKLRKEYPPEDFEKAFVKLTGILRAKKPGGYGYGKKRSLYDFLTNKSYGFIYYVHKG